MSNNRRGGEHDFSHSMTDLMSGVAVTFLLIAAIFMVQAFVARTKEAAAEQRNRDELERIRSKDHEARDFLETLLQRFADDPVVEPEYDAARDPYLLILTLKRDRFLFPAEGCELDAGMQRAVHTDLRAAVKEVCDATGAGERIESITMEGHTDARPFYPHTTRCGATPAGACSNASHGDCRLVGFSNNVRLSGARAQNVFFELRKAIGNDMPLASCLDRLFVVAGRGPVEAKADVTDDAGRQLDRRVVIIVRVRAGTVHAQGQPQ